MHSGSQTRTKKGGFISQSDKEEIASMKRFLPWCSYITYGAITKMRRTYDCAEDIDQTGRQTQHDKAYGKSIGVLCLKNWPTGCMRITRLITFKEAPGGCFRGLELFSKAIRPKKHYCSFSRNEETNVRLIELA